MRIGSAVASASRFGLERHPKRLNISKWGPLIRPMPPQQVRWQLALHGPGQQSVAPAPQSSAPAMASHGVTGSASAQVASAQEFVEGPAAGITGMAAGIWHWASTSRTRIVTEPRMDSRNRDIPAA